MWDDLFYHFVYMTQTWINKNDGWTYMTLIFYRTILPNTKDANAIPEPNYMFRIYIQWTPKNARISKNKFCIMAIG